MMARTTVHLSATSVNGFVATPGIPKKNPKMGVVIEAESDLRFAQLISKGDEQAFATVLDRYHAGMVRLAITFIPNRTVAEERVKDAWMDVLEYIAHYDALSSLKTWIFCLLHARLSQGPQPSISNGQHSNFPVYVQRFDNHQHSVHHAQNVFSQRISDSSHNHPDFKLLTKSIKQWLASMKPIQRQVITLHDMEQFSPDEVCTILKISEVTYHTELHLARTFIQKMIMNNFEHGPNVPR